MPNQAALVMIVMAGSLPAALFAQEQAPTTATSPEEVRAIVSEMLADAESRSSLLAAPGAGHDGKFYIASDDSSFRLNLGGYSQFRYYMNFRSDENTVGARPDDDFEPGFQNQRTKLSFSGNVVSPDWTYGVLTNFSSSTGSEVLQDAWVEYNLGKGWKAKWGQFKLPLNREELVSEPSQLTIERSLINTWFSQDRSQIAQISYEDEAVRVTGAYSDGLNSDNTEFTSTENTAFIVSGEADWALTSRVEWKVRGKWDQFRDFTSPRGAELGVLLAAAAHYQQSPNSSNFADTDRDTLQYTCDASIEGDGWNAFAAFIGRNDETRSFVSPDTDFNDFGLVVQGGVRVLKDTEPYIRWEGFIPDDDRGLAEDVYNFLTFGVAEYIAGQAIKVMADVVWSVEDTAGLVGLGLLPQTGVGILGDSESGETVIRIQFQTMF
jgi:hypothetical protein